MQATNCINVEKHSFFSSFSFQNTVTMIPAHDSPVAALTFNASATKLASASERVRTHPPYDIWEGGERELILVIVMTSWLYLLHHRAISFSFTSPFIHFKGFNKLRLTIHSVCSGYSLSPWISLWFSFLLTFTRKVPPTDGQIIMKTPLCLSFW